MARFRPGLSRAAAGNGKQKILKYFDIKQKPFYTIHK